MPKIREIKKVQQCKLFKITVISVSKCTTNYFKNSLVLSKPYYVCVRLQFNENKIMSII